MIVALKHNNFNLEYVYLKSEVEYMNDDRYDNKLSEEDIVNVSDRLYEEDYIYDELTSFIEEEIDKVLLSKEKSKLKVIRCKG